MCGIYPGMSEPHRFFNARPFIWDPHLDWHWTEYPDYKFAVPGYQYTLFEQHVKATFPEGDSGWFGMILPFCLEAKAAKYYASDSYFFHYWLSRMVEWEGLAIHSLMYGLTMRASAGSETHHGKRVTEADKAAIYAELEWTKRFP